jgi:hypothetical protein
MRKNVIYQKEAAKEADLYGEHHTQTLSRISYQIRTCIGLKKMLQL